MGDKAFRIKNKFIATLFVVFILLSSSMILATVSGLNNDQRNGSITDANYKTSTFTIDSSRDPRLVDAKNWTEFHGDNNNQGYSAVRVPLIGHILWRKLFKEDNDPTMIYSSPVILNEQIYIGTNNHFFYSLDKFTGEINWQVSTDDLPGSQSGGSIVSTATIMNDRIYFGCDDTYIYCFDATPDDNGDGNITATEDEGVSDVVDATYDLLWFFKTDGAVKSSPKVVGNTVVIGSFENRPVRAKLYALDAATGALKWNFTAPKNSSFYSTPAIENDMVYIGLETEYGSTSHTVYAFDLNGFMDAAENDGWNGESKTGNKDADIIWNITTDGGVDSSITIAGNKLLFGALDSNGTFYAINKNTGAEIWNRTTGGQIFSSPAVDIANNVVYIGSDSDKLFALNLSNGNIFWSYIVGADIQSTPVIADDVVLFGSVDGHFYAVKGTTANIPSSQRFLWKHWTDGSVDSSAAVVEGMAFVASESGYIYAFMNPDMAVKFGSLKVSERYPFEGESLDMEAEVYNNGSIELSASANFYFHLTISQSGKRLVTEELISSHPVKLDIDESMIVYTSGTVIDYDWASVDMSTILIKIEDVSFPEKVPVEFNNLDFEIINVLEPYTDGWMNYQKDDYNSGLGDFGAKTNKTLWKFDSDLGTGTSHFRTSPLFAKGRIFIGSTNGKMYSILDSNGKKDWEYNAGSPILGTPALLMSKIGQIEFEKIFFGTDDGNVHALNINRGKLNWTYDLGNPVRGPPLVANGTVYIGSMSGELIALDEDGFWDGDQGSDDADESIIKGDVLWNITISGAIKSAPVLINNTIIITSTTGSINSEIFAIDRNSGNTVWSYKFDSSTSGSPVIDATNYQVIIGVNDNSIYAFDINGFSDGNQGEATEKIAANNNADILWSYDAQATIPASGAVDVLNNKVVFGTSDGYLYSLNLKTGKVYWIFFTGGSVLASPTIADGLVYAGSDNGMLYCIKELKDDPDSTNATLLWQFDTLSSIRAPPVAIQYSAYIGTETGVLYKLGAPNDPPVAKINEPAANQTFFSDENITFNATDSFDPEGDIKLTYIWTYIPKGTNDPPSDIYTGSEPMIKKKLAAGDYTIFLKILDGLGMASELNSTNITVFSPVIRVFENDTIPAECKIFYDGAGGVDLYATTDPGAGVGLGGKSVGGIDKFVNLYYSSLREQFKVNWYNVSIGYDQTDLPEEYNVSRVRLFRRLGNYWVKSSESGIVTNNRLVWGNLSGDLIRNQVNQLYAPGTFDNLPPQIRIIDNGPTPVNGSKNQLFEFKIEYKDSDNDFPGPEFGGYVSIELNGISYPMIPTSDNDTDVTDGKFYTFSISGNDLNAGENNSYRFKVHDGTYLAKSVLTTGPEVFTGQSPVADAGFDLDVEQKEVFELDASGSTDADGTITKFFWDTDNDGDFSDSGGSTEGVKTTWKFDIEGEYIITLMVVDNDGNTDKDSITVIVRPKKIVDGDGAGETMLALYAAVIVLIIIVILIIVLLLMRRKMQEDRDKKAFMVGEGEEECEDEDEELEDDEDEEDEGEEDEGEEDEDEEDEDEEAEDELEDLEDDEEFEEDLEEDDLDDDLDPELDEELDEDELDLDEDSEEPELDGEDDLEEELEPEEFEEMEPEEDMEPEDSEPVEKKPKKVKHTKMKLKAKKVKGSKVPKKIKKFKGKK
jgi:outer membrane protein assembly factor BamB